MYNDDPLRQPGPHTRNLAIATANRYLPTEREGRKLLLKRTEVPVVKLRLSVMISLLVPSAVAALQTPGFGRPAVPAQRSAAPLLWGGHAASHRVPLPVLFLQNASPPPPPPPTMAVDRREEDDDSEQGWAKLFQLGFALLWSGLPAGFQTLILTVGTSAVCSLLGYIGLGVNRLDTRLNKLDTKLSAMQGDLSLMKGDLSLVKLLCCSLVTWGLAKEWNSHLDSLGKSKSA